MTSATDKVASDKAEAQAASDKAAAEKVPPAKSANEVLARVDDDHDWKHDPQDLNSTGGIRKAIERNRDAIQALADFIDKK